MQKIDIAGGSVVGAGALPHRDADEAAEFALAHMDVPAIPTLPRRSPAEGAIAQAMVGMRGVTVGQYGSIAVDPARVDPLAPIHTDLLHDSFVGFRTFLEHARGHEGWVKWQVTGPVTLGMALIRAGVPMNIAFESAVRAVRARAQQLLDVVAEAMPAAKQMVFVEEPDFGQVMTPGFVLAPDTAIDLVSGALAAIEQTAVAGLHVCGMSDLASQLATGPGIVSVPVRADVADAAGYLVSFMDRGGYIAWGAAPTNGPLSASAERPWRQLSELWCRLVERGADPGVLRRQALIVPECGLVAHTPAIAERVYKVAEDVARRVRDQAGASRWALGA